MFDIVINPVLLSIGESISIRYYGLVYALGFLFAYVYLRHRVKKNRLGLSLEAVDQLMVYAIVGGIVGARVGEFLFFQPDVLFSAPLELFKIWKGGMSFHGGILGFVVATLLFVRQQKKQNNDISFFNITDTIVIPASLVVFFGRIANFTNAELCGRVTNVSWAVNLNNPPLCDGFRHPSQLYEALKNLFMFIVLIAHDKQQQLKNRYQEGYATWLFVFMYGVLRTLTNIWRDDVLWFFGVLSTGQLLSSIMALIAGYILITKYWFKSSTRAGETKQKHKQQRKVNSKQEKNKNNNNNKEQ
jgi:phosphatidylglycerol:prolipoprotein diacylglycerol transferase